MDPMSRIYIRIRVHLSGSLVNSGFFFRASRITTLSPTVWEVICSQCSTKPRPHASASAVPTCLACGFS